MATTTIQITDASPIQLMAYGDAALRVGHADLAEGLYRRAIRDGDESERRVALDASSTALSLAASLPSTTKCGPTPEPSRTAKYLGWPPAAW